jgi:hypothetical protein
VKYRKLPVVIEAFQMVLDSDGKIVTPWPNWLNEAWGTQRLQRLPSNAGRYSIKTLEGVMDVDWGDWIIKGVKGELYPCKPDIFSATYESADQPTGTWTREPPTEADRQRALLDCAKAANALSEWLEMYGWKDDDDYIKMRAALAALRELLEGLENLVQRELNIEIERLRKR